MKGWLKSRDQKYLKIHATFRGDFLKSASQSWLSSNFPVLLRFNWSLNNHALCHTFWQNVYFVDIDECLFANGGCEGGCVNKYMDRDGMTRE